MPTTLAAVIDGGELVVLTPPTRPAPAPASELVALPATVVTAVLVEERTSLLKLLLLGAETTHYLGDEVIIGGIITTVGVGQEQFTQGPRGSLRTDHRRTRHRGTHQ